MFKNMKIGSRMFLGFGGLTFLLIIIAAISIQGVTKLNDSIIEVVTDRWPKTVMANNIIDQINIVARALRNMALLESKDEISKEAERIEAARKIVNEEIGKLQKTVSTEKGKDILKKLIDARAAYTESQKRVIALILNGKKSEAVPLLFTHLRPLQQQYFDHVEKMIKYQGELVDQAGQRSREFYASLRAFLLILSVVIVLLSMTIAYLITRSVTRPLSDVAGGIGEAAGQVASASEQVAASSQSLAEGASEQAASIEETSSSLEEMSSMTKQNAEHATEADTLMRSANDIVKKANGSMGELTKSMSDITKASEETSKIIKTIDEIAFQTNLLALNAAVEAARAGEAGAGFAVVAGEVRNLAMRAADAAKNTASLIEGTVKKVKDGSQLVTRTNEAFMEVAKSAAKVGELVAEIAAASNEQAQGIDQVNKAVAEMDKVVQQNAANSEESASASEEMNAQANQMKVFVGNLMSMIGGSSTRRLDSGGSAARREKISSKRRIDVPVKLVGNEIAPYRSKEVSPDKVIPLEEKDFKDF